MNQNTIVIATQNKGKLFEFKQLLVELPYNFKSIGEFTNTEPDETGTTYEENALIKAKAAYEVTKIPAVADDSGLSIHSLNGAPGVNTADLAIQDDGTRDYHAAYRKLIDMIGDKDPAASYVCVLAYFDGKEEKFFRAELAGKVDFSHTHELADGCFGYDPIFVPDGFEGKTVSQLGNTIKNTISARSKAVKAFGDWLQKGI